jgi:hypothetical protein
MLSFDVKLGPDGFWFALSVAGEGPNQFYLEYVAIGPGSRHTSGVVEGVVDGDCYEYVRLTFAPVRVGIIHADVTHSSERRRVGDRMTRRQLVMTALAGGAVAAALPVFGRTRGSLDLSQLHHEVFPQTALPGSPVQAFSSSVEQQSGYPYPYPYPYPHPLPA